VEQVIYYPFIGLQLLLAIFLFYFILASFMGAPVAPSTNNAAKSMIKLARIKKGMIVYDLGSGTGKLLFLAAEKGAKACGFEINPFLVLITNLRALLSPYRGFVSAHWKNLWKADLAPADVVFTYLLPDKMSKLEDKIIRECKKKTIIVANSFIFNNLPCIRKDTKNHVYAFEVR